MLHQIWLKLKRWFRLIKKLFYEHQVEMERSRRQILAELDSYPNESDIIFNNKTKALKPFNLKGDKFRGSNYRGVSVNGKSWQVFIVINKCKWYAGCVESEEKAAAIYDRLAIIFHGLKVLYQRLKFLGKNELFLHKIWCPAVIWNCNWRKQISI